MHPMQMSIACFLSMIRPPGVEFENSYLQILPIDKYKCPYVRDTNDIGFRLYTKHNPTVYEEIYIGDDATLASSHINFKDQTVIYFHAFLESPDAGSAVLVREAYMLRGDTNVIMVDAQRLEAGPWYFTAAENTWFIGQFGARLVDYLVSRGLDLSRTHLVGHSLGAQAAGVAGSALHSGRVARITGLDPAMPLFEKLPYSQKLDANDAHFVDVIHTDAGIFGVQNPIGHADFYPNGGISPQPGCELEIVFPRQQVLEKCKAHTRTKPLNGLYFFELQTHEQTKQKEKSDIKLQKYYKYSKKERDTKTLNTNKNAKQQTKTVTTTTTEKVHTKKDLSRNEDMIISYQNHRPIYTKPDKNHSPIYIKTDQNSPIYTKTDQNSPIYIKPDKNQSPIYTKPDQNQSPIYTKPDQNHSPIYTTRDQNSPTYTKIDQNDSPIYTKPETAPKNRQKRFSLFRRPSEAEEQDNFIHKMVEFLIKHRKNVIPVVSVMREINTLVKNGNNQLSHTSKERNSYIGTPPPVFVPLTYNLELGKDPPLKAFVKNMLGLGTQTEKLSIGGSSGLFGRK